MNPLSKLLIVEDDQLLSELIGLELKLSVGCKVIAAHGVDCALQLLEEHDVDMILSDYLMPDGSGLDLLHRIRAAKIPVPPMIVITGLTEEHSDGLERHGVAAVVRKPFAPH